MLQKRWVPITQRDVLPESMRERLEILEHTHLMGIRSLQPAVVVLLQQKMQNGCTYAVYFHTGKDDPHYYIHNEVGYNYRMTNLQAALGVAQMEELPEFIKRKHSNYELYQKLLDGFELGKLLGFREGTYSNQWFYSLEIPMERVNGSLRDIITKLQERGVQTRAIWGLIHEQLPYQNAITYEMEKAPYYSKCILNFPSSTQITEDDIVYVVEQIKDVLMS